MEPEYFQYLLLMLLTIAKSRPENLLHLARPEFSSKFVSERKPKASKDKDGEGGDKEGEGEGGGKDDESGEKEEDKELEVSAGGDQEVVGRTEKIDEFLDLLNEAFWMLFAQQPLAPETGPVVNPGKETPSVHTQDHCTCSEVT